MKIKLKRGKSWGALGSDGIPRPRPVLPFDHVQQHVPGTGHSCTLGCNVEDMWRRVSWAVQENSFECKSQAHVQQNVLQ